MISIKERAKLLLDKFKTSSHAFMIITPIIIGLLGGLGAALLRTLVHFFQQILWGNATYTASRLLILLIPAAGAFLVGLIIHYFCQEAKGHGVPEVMEAIAIRNGKIRPRVVVGKVVASAITIASGGSVGREGPIVQIGSAIGSSIGQTFRLSRRRMQTLVGCGAAAGIAAAFNAPIAGAMFAVEIILGDFAVSQFTPIVISSVSATVVSRIFYGDFPAFLVPKYELVHPVELVPYAILGVITGFIAILFVKSLYYLEDRFDSLKKPDYIKTTIGGLIVGLYGLSFPQIFGVGYEAMNLALLGNMEVTLLLALIFLKILASSMTLGSGSSGGIFAPSLFIGAMTGGLFGKILNNLFPSVTAGPGAYSLVAMSALVAATTHAPITAFLIIFEMTGDYKIILPLMIATFISSFMVTRTQKGSIYTLKLMKRGIHFQQGREINVLRSMRVQDVMRHSIELISPKASLKEMIESFIKSEHAYFYCLNEAGEITEKISQVELSAVAPDYENLQDFVVAHDIATPNMVMVRETDSLDVVMKEFAKENVGEIPVISSQDPTKILGTVWRIDVISAYNKEILKRDLEGEVLNSMKRTSYTNLVEVVEGFYMLEIDVPPSFVGKSIKDLGVRNNFGVDIILIRRPSKDNKLQTRLPEGTYRFQKKDQLLIFGRRKKVELLSHL